MIINRSWILIIHKARILRKSPLNKRYWPSKRGFKIYKLRVITMHVKMNQNCLKVLLLDFVFKNLKFQNRYWNKVQYHDLLVKNVKQGLIFVCLYSVHKCKNPIQGCCLTWGVSVKYWIDVITTEPMEGLKIWVERGIIYKEWLILPSITKIQHENFLRLLTFCTKIEFGLDFKSQPGQVETFNPFYF